MNAASLGYDFVCLYIGYMTGTSPCSQQTLLGLAYKIKDAYERERCEPSGGHVLPTLPPSDYVGGLAGLAKREAGR
jgi:hypothetical protein